MELKAGYKQTEVGVIPEDWECCELADAVEFLDGQRRPVKSSDRAKIQGIYPYYGASGIVDYVNDYIFDDELILLGEDGENILSRNLPLAFQVSGKIWVNNHAHVMKPKESFSIGYLTAFLESLDYSLLNSGTAQPKLNKHTCLKIKVAKPKKTEQEAIAKALSDMDAFIDSLEQLIAKKRNIKQGAMQELLTGKRRLPGFEKKTGYKQTAIGVIPEDWDDKKIGDISDKIIGGGTPSRAQSHFWNGKIPWMTVKDFATFDSQSTQEFITQKGLKNSSANLIPKGNIIASTRMALGKAVIYNVDVAINQDLKAIFLNENINSLYILYYFQQNRLVIEQLGSGSTVAGISKSDLENLRIPLPPTKAEQEAIAKVLSDMDSEMEALEGKLGKARKIKQGMMEQLLTGKTRLVDTSGNAG